MKYHIVKQSEGVTYVSGIEFDTALEATKQANHLRDTSDDDDAEFMVLDDLELLAFMQPTPGGQK